MDRLPETHAETHVTHANAAKKLTRKLTPLTVTGITAGQKLTRKLTRFTITERTNSRQILTPKLTRVTVIKESAGQKLTHNSRPKLTHPLSLKREEGVRTRPAREQHPTQEPPVTDTCPRCLTTTRRPTPHHDEPAVRYRCSNCGHTWTTTYDPDAYDITDDSMPRHWTDLN